MTVLGSQASLAAIPEPLRAGGASTHPRVATEFDLTAAAERFGDLARGVGGLHQAVFVQTHRPGRDPAPGCSPA